MSVSTGVLSAILRPTTRKRPAKWVGAALRMGELPRLAEQQFDVFVTVDRNLSYQQNPGSFQIGVVVLRAKTNRLAELRQLVPELLEALKAGLSPGTVRIIGGG